jgi:hypothetical protein
MLPTVQKVSGPRLLRQSTVGQIDTNGLHRPRPPSLGAIGRKASAPARLRAASSLLKSQNSCSPSNSERSSSSLSCSSNASASKWTASTTTTAFKSLFLIGRQKAVDLIDENMSSGTSSQADEQLVLFQSDFKTTTSEAVDPCRRKSTAVTRAEVHHHLPSFDDDPQLGADLSSYLELSPLRSEARLASMEDLLCLQELSLL